MSSANPFNRSSKDAKIAVWAVDPFERETRPSPAVVKELRQWAESSGVRIQPVHVFHAPSADASSVDRGVWMSRYISALEKEVFQYLDGMDLSSLLLPPKVLLQRGDSIRGAVDVLNQYAKDLSASWLLVSSKGKSGLRRMALGSFAESLLLNASLPVWVFGHGKAEELDSKRIVFATDFSDASKSAFEQVVQQAALLGSSVTLFHCINLPDSMLSGGAGAMGVVNCFPVEEYLNDQTDWAKAQAADWIKRAKKAGVQVKLAVQQIAPNVANAIVFEARRVKAGVIALASMSGPVGAALLGSHARQVIRQSECPVWVFGPKCPAQREAAVESVRAVNAG